MRERESSAVITLSITFDAKPILQLFVTALCTLNQPLNKKITKMVLHVSLHFKSYLEDL